MEGNNDTALQRAAKAWSELNIAESQIKRLNGYTNPTPAMKADRSRHVRTAAQARATLNSVLKVAA